MPAYLIADESITDPEVFEEYKREVLPLISRYGGRFLSRGGDLEVLGKRQGMDSRAHGCHRSFQT